MGWMGNLFGSRPAPTTFGDPEKAKTIERLEIELGRALDRHQEIVKSVHRDLAEGVLAEVMKGRK